MSVAYLLLLPALVHGITVDIQVSDTTGITAEATGLFEATINEDHKELFHLTDQLLKNAVFKITGQYGEVYLKEPNLGSDVYGNYKLEPVRVVLKANGTKILNITKEEVVLNRLQTFNHEAISSSQYIKLKGNIEDKMTCIWKQNAVFQTKVLYNVDVIGLGKNPSWIAKSTFGRNLHQKQSIPLTDASFTVNLGPNSDVIATLSATKVTIVMEINYIAGLTGHVLAKFDENYIWGYENHDIKSVMEAAAMPDSVMISEEITLQYYTGCVIILLGTELNATKNDLSQCFFSVDGGKNESSLNWSSARYKTQVKTTESVILDVPELSKGNNAVKNLGTSILLFASLLLLQSF